MKKDSDALSIALAAVLLSLPFQAVSQEPARPHFIPGAAVELSSTNANLRDDTGAFHPADSPLSGDGQVTVRLLDVDTLDRFARVGLMLRATTESGAKHIMVVFSPTNGVGVHYGLAANDARGRDHWHLRNPLADGWGRVSVQGADIASDALAAAQTPLKPPLWLRLARRGNVFQGFASTDGTNWLWAGTSPKRRLVG